MGVAVTGAGPKLPGFGFERGGQKKAFCSLSLLFRPYRLTEEFSAWTQTQWLLIEKRNLQCEIC